MTTTAGTIAVIEDDEDIRSVICYNLERNGYVVLQFADGEEGLRRVLEAPPDLLLLDLMLPGTDGHDICRELRAQQHTRDLPLIMVTAKTEESDVVLGLGLGADDYIVKPFRPAELIARVKARLRGRSRRNAMAGRTTFHGLVIDHHAHRVVVDGLRRDLTATEFRILALLADHPGRAWTREQLIQKAIGDDVIVETRNVDVHIRHLRQKVAPYDPMITTIRGHGYGFDPEAYGQG